MQRSRDPNRRRGEMRLKLSGVVRVAEEARTGDAGDASLLRVDRRGDVSVTSDLF